MEARLQFVKSDDKEIKRLQRLTAIMICKMKLRTAHQKASRDFENIVMAREGFRPQDMLIEKSKIDDNDNDYDYDHEEEEEEEKKPSGRLDCMVYVLNIFRKFLRLTPSTQEVNVEHLKEGKHIYY
ncbi:hypothetical protein MTR67_046919 [Solanum verrucosum]|uniref:Uncharacterized protein n=1 Tax=Solanum verrucosum TaxID=315347 RepID=A0AAF0UXV3_SOLVR|nr:hypothetical protein MTR67_046919 [Solanum verrucosum]